ncbi:MAG TPA: pyridoxal phosphate-dependent aminotransferase [Thiolinea sp.]|nr:pyridoxal phosphate-dependent aminotransferase [Thiolinea sp.]
MSEHNILAARMKSIQPFHVMDILARARQLASSGRSIIHMEVGEPDFTTPSPIIEAGLQALKDGQTKYTPACGIPELRERIAEWYWQAFQVKVAAERIIVTPGASGALQLALGVLVNPQDEVILTDPGYPCNRHFVSLFEGKPISLPVTAEQNYQPSLNQLQQAWSERTRAVLLASPANPTGTLLSTELTQQLYQYITQQHSTFIVDEIYQGLTYGQEPQTALSIADDIWIVNSFSKYFGMTGWRLGWLIAPEYALDALTRLAQNLFLSPPTIAQYAALAAFKQETLDITEERRFEFAKRRDFLLPALRELGFGVQTAPQGAFYIYADAGRFSDNSHELSLRLLEQAGVAFTPGIDFGEYAAKTHVRFAYTTNLPELEQAVERLHKHLRS